jgi:phosphatidylglycerophosphate synthase
MQIEAIPDSTAGAMDQTTERDSIPATGRMRTAAFAVHIFTAMGAGIALLAMLEAVREHWANMFGWLGVALIIDAIDGPLARRLDVVRLQPNWSGEVLDLVVDFVTYVFVPAYAITASGMLLPVAAPILGIGIMVSGALYFADRRMKASDNHFRGFPALWNAAAFYLFLLHLPPAIRMMSRQDSSAPRTTRTGSVSPISQTSMLSSAMRNTSASSRPIWRARLACAGGMRETITEMKMTLSMPSTISSAVNVSSATHASGLASNSIMP